MASLDELGGEVANLVPGVDGGRCIQGLDLADKVATVNAPAHPVGGARLDL